MGPLPGHARHARDRSPPSKMTRQRQWSKSKRRPQRPKEKMQVWITSCPETNLIAFSIDIAMASFERLAKFSSFLLRMPARIGILNFGHGGGILSRMRSQRDSENRPGGCRVIVWHHLTNGSSFTASAVSHMSNANTPRPAGPHQPHRFLTFVIYVWRY